MELKGKPKISESVDIQDEKPKIYESVDIQDETAYENILKHRIKPIGKWQWIIFLILVGPSGVPMVLFPAFTTSIAIPHRCRVHQLDSFSLTYDQVTNLTIPFKIDPNMPPMVGQSYQPCLQYNTSWLDNLPNLNISSYDELINRRPPQNESNLFQCSDGVLMDSSKSEYRGSAVETFNMVCDRSKLAPLSNTVYLISQTVACLITGHLADHFGRKPVVVVFGFIQMISAFLVCFSYNIYVFYALRMVIGFSAITVPTVGFILLVEITDSKYRNMFTAISSLAFGFIFGSLFTIAAYLFQNWRWLHAFLGLITTPCILFPWLLCESPRWLFTMGRGEDAIRVIQNGIKLNNPEAKLTDSEESDLIVKMPTAHTGKETFTENVTQIIILFKTREMLKRTSIVAFSFFAHGLVYFGTTFYSVKLRGNRYLMFWIMCLFAIPANLLQFILYHNFNRKRPLIALLTLLIPIFVGVMIYQSLATSQDSILPVMVGTSLGKLIIDATFSMMFIYTGEIFPTEARSASVGTVAAFSRVGAAVAPFIIRLSDDVWRPLPFVVFALVTVVCISSVLCLPETKNRPLYDTVDQLEKHRLEKAERKRNDP